MIKKFFMGLLGAVALTACSSDPTIDDPASKPDLDGSESHISVAIEMTANPGSRANDGFFEDGTAPESKVENIVFFFFDAEGKCIEVQKVDNPTFKDPAQPSINPNITNYGTVEVRLKAGLDYKKVGVALNSPAQNATALKSEIKTISDFLERSYDYAAGVKTDGSGQVMSNSIYYAMDKASDTPVAGKKVDVVEITDKNIYTTAQKNTIDQLIASGTKEYVEIFVERVLSKIEVGTPDFDMSKYYIYEDNGTKKYTITTYDNVNGTSKEITVRPVVKGMTLNVLTPKTALIKPIHLNEVGYGVGDGEYKNFQWNDPDNKRSYWASTALSDETDMIYYSWNQTEKKGIGAITQYVHPNTQDYKPISSNERQSLNTKVMVVAELHEFEGTEDKGAVDLVMFGPDYMLANDMLAHVASVVNRDIRLIDWENVSLDVELTADQRSQIAAVVNDAYQDKSGYKATDLVLSVGEIDENADNGFGDSDWAAIVTFKSGISTPALNGLPEGTLSIVAEAIKKVRDATIDGINDTYKILYWKNGKTYYYANIRHQGFTWLTGKGETDFLYGVVRNHIYRVSLTGIYGLGTPVIDPDRPINPDRPDGDRPSYIRAKINILPWRVVTNSAVIH